MTERMKQRIRLVYGLVLSVSLLAAGLCLIVSCVEIYRSGDQPFSRETVAAHFEAIQGPVYLCLALILGGFLLELAIPAEKEKRAGKQDALILKRLYEKTDLSQCSDDLRAAVAAEQKKRGLNKQNLLWLLSFCTIGFLSHILTGGIFQLPDINGSMLRAIGILAFWLVIPFAYALFITYRGRKSIQREIDLLKTAPAEARRTAPTHTEIPRKDHTPAIRCVIALAAAALLLYGYFTGGTMDVLTKAINICTECVGLG